LDTWRKGQGKNGRSGDDGWSQRIFFGNDNIQFFFYLALLPTTINQLSSSPLLSIFFRHDLFQMSAGSPPASTGTVSVDAIKQIAESKDPKKLSGISLYSRFAFAGAVCCSVTHGALTPVDV
jgi:hypothetical protein